jgi:CHC2 zinc finger
VKNEPVTSFVTRLVEALQCGDPHCDCRRTGTDKHTLRCPAHDDKHPSFTVTVRDDKVLLHCFAGCSQDAVIDALRKRGLWGQKSTDRIPHGNARYSVTERGFARRAAPHHR